MPANVPWPGKCLRMMLPTCGVLVHRRLHGFFLCGSRHVAHDEAGDRPSSSHARWRAQLVGAGEGGDGAGAVAVEQLQRGGLTRMTRGEEVRTAVHEERTSRTRNGDASGVEVDVVAAVATVEAIVDGGRPTCRNADASGVAVAVADVAAAMFFMWRLPLRCCRRLYALCMSRRQMVQ